MLRDTRLNLLPNVLNCLSWSAGGELALVASEDVIILVPKGGIRHAKRVQEFDHSRASVRERIIADMEKDIPPADSDIYSIGEEQGPGYAKEVAWSPLGLSEHRRCLLAVATTNHKVYIFQPSDHSDNNWNPIHNLESYISQYRGWTDNNKDPVVTRKRMRFKSISWSSPCHQVSTSRWGESILAAANDFSEIVLFRIKLDGVDIFREISLEEGNKGKYFARCLSWSPWEDMGNQMARCFLAYAIGGKMMVSKIMAKSGDSSSYSLSLAVEEPAVLGKAVSEKHPIFAIAWSQDVIDGRMILAYAVQRRVSVLALDENAHIVSSKNFTNEFIEPVAGLQFTPSKNEDAVGLQMISSKGRFQVIDFISSQGVDTHPTMSTVHGQGDIEMAEISGGLEAEEIRAKMNRWPNLLSERKQDFMGERDLPAAEIRAYGLTVSPFGGIVAICYSLHPADSLQYITASKERTIIMFGTHEGLGSLWRTRAFDMSKRHGPTPATLSSEALLLEATAIGTEFIENCKRRLELPGNIGSRRKEQDATLLRANDPAEPPVAFLLDSPSLNALRYISVLELLDQKAPDGPSGLDDNADIIAAQVLSVLQMPRDDPTASSALSKRILYSLATVGILGFFQSKRILKLCKEAFLWLDAHTNEDVNFMMELNIIEKHIAGGDNPMISQIISSFEKCPICRAGMVWRDLKVAECAKAHRFSRCATTFLPIVRPDGTKECIVCGRTVFGKSELTRSADPDDEKNNTLAHQVFSHWDICLQCGGRYWTQS